MPVRNDPLMDGFLAAGDEVARRRELERLLVEHVRPVVAAVVGRFARRGLLSHAEDAEDLEAAVTLRAIRKLQRLAAGEGEAIEQLPEYVARLARNTITDALRKRYPEMRRLRQRVDYLLRRDARFEVWTADGTMLCGRAEWKGRSAVDLPVTPENAGDAMRNGGEAAESVDAVFERAGGPVALDDLIRLMAKLWNVADVVHVDVSEKEAMDEHPSPQAEYESRRFLEALWSEVQALRPAQRAALLLNLRDIDGSNALSLLMILEIATFDQIAAALEIPPEQLAGLWSDLPLDDMTIASLLGLKRQQVINLRRAARERLSRRMR